MPLKGPSSASWHIKTILSYLVFQTNCSYQYQCWPLPSLIEQSALPVRDEAPVLHRSRDEVGDGDHVHFREREGDVEVLLVVGQHLR